MTRVICAGRQGSGCEAQEASGDRRAPGRRARARRPCADQSFYRACHLDGVTAAAELAALAERLFGEAWAADVARLTDVNERTVRRIRQAAREGREYPGARGVLAALDDAVRPIAAELQAFSRRC